MNNTTDSLIKTYRPNILILGNKRHGKDSVAEILRDNFGMKFLSSSMVAAEKVMMSAFADQNVFYKTPQDCFDDRFGHREFWFDQIKEYNRNDPKRLCKEILSLSSVYVGMRSNIEYQACKELFDIILWVDRSEHLPNESKESFNIEFNQDEMYVISNNNSEEDLLNTILMFMRNRL